MITNEQDVANPGLIRPPLVYLASIVLGVILNRFVVIEIPIDSISKPVGGLVLLVALVLFYLTQKQFELANTPIPGNRKTTSIITSGPFTYSRNPIYLVFTLIQISVAFWLQIGWVLILLAIPLMVMSLVVIPREELYMTGQFGEEYTAYKARVRRWV